MTTRRQRRQLDALYASLPRIACQGLCVASCGPLGMTAAEADRITETTGAEPGTTADYTCTLLDRGRCQVYTIRPLICRLWGIVESMPCQWGCRPSRVLTDREGFAFLSRARAIGGDDVLTFEAPAPARGG